MRHAHDSIARRVSCGERVDADFVVEQLDGAKVVEDTKGMLTDVFRLKRKMVEDQFGIKIVLVYAKPKRRKRGKQGKR